MVSKREKFLIGGLLLAGGLAGVGGYLVWPTITSITANFQKKGQLESDIKSQETLIAANQQVVYQLQQVKALPPGVTLRTYRPDALQANIKSMLDRVMNVASANGNDLIALEPWEAGATASTAPAVSVSVKTGDAAKTSPPAAGADASKSAPPPEEPPNLTTFGYALTLRGGYDSIQGFLSGLNNYSELVEMRDITLENESGENRGKADAPLANPLKPIKMTARLALYLQPE